MSPTLHQTALDERDALQARNANSSKRRSQALSSERDRLAGELEDLRAQHEASRA